MKPMPTTLIASLMLTGCATMHTPRNMPGSLYATQQQRPNAPEQVMQCHAPLAPKGLDRFVEATPAALVGNADILADGDRLRLTISGDKDRLTGTYVIAADGTITLMGVHRIMATGQTRAALEQVIRARLIDARLIRALSNGVRLEQVELSGVPISVAGAVFEPGIVRVGERQPEVRSLNISNIVSGDLNSSRTLAVALRAAGGLRPDGDAAAVYLFRGTHFARIDMSAAIDGGIVPDVPVMAGDQIIVATVGCLQEKMVRPSQITAPGIRVYLSNLSRPASSNSASGINKDATSMPYGTRMSQALVNANCVGGSAMNAGRSAVLMSRNPVTGQSIVISRRVEQIVRDRNRDAMDPWLMPGDAIACYDSVAMNLRDVVSVISETVTPIVLFKNVSK